MDSFVKGLWAPSDVDPIGQNLFDGPFTWPVMVARRSAIDANIATMAAYCADNGVEHAPHGKTTMSPTLFAAQLAAGAWGITVATANQALAARRFGVPRVLLANELLDRRVLRWAADEVAAGWEFMCYVDSLAGVAALREAGGRLRVLVEMGFEGGRTGCRTVADAVAVARAASDVDGVEVAGVAGFEGGLADRAAVDAFLADMVRAAREVAPYCPDQLILSAGGSAFFDAVLSAFTGPARENGWRVMLRSGAYVTHDHGLYARLSPIRFDAALSVWAQVLSTPEPGLAILGAGKRDLPYDAGLPVVLSHDGVVERLNDQHAYVRGLAAEPGDLVRLGISHPCTAFDKWRVIPVVDDDHTVVDLLHTYF